MDTRMFDTMSSMAVCMAAAGQGTTKPPASKFKLAEGEHVHKASHKGEHQHKAKRAATALPMRGL